MKKGKRKAKKDKQYGWMTVAGNLIPILQLLSKKIEYKITWKYNITIKQISILSCNKERQNKLLLWLNC